MTGFLTSKSVLQRMQLGLLFRRQLDVSPSPSEGSVAAHPETVLAASRDAMWAFRREKELLAFVSSLSPRDMTCISLTCR